MLEEANLLNEEARIRVDSLNTEAHNLQLRETLKRTEDELNAKDRLIDKYQLEIRQRNDEIEKKVSPRKIRFVGDRQMNRQTPLSHATGLAKPLLPGNAMLLPRGYWMMGFVRYLTPTHCPLALSPRPSPRTVPGIPADV